MGGLCKFFLMFCCLTGRVSGKFEHFTEEVYKLANEVLEKYFQVFKCVTFAADDTANGDYLRKVLPGLVIKLPLQRDVWTMGELLKATFEQGCGGFFVQTGAENRVAVARALIDAKNKAVSYRYNMERYLFLPMSQNDTNADVLLDKRMFFLPNFLFVVPDEPSGRFLIKGHTVFEPEKGDASEVVDAWSLRGGFEHGKDLYPDKIKDVRGKELVLGLMHYVPYSVIIHEGNKTIYDGVESRIAEEFVRSINGTYDGLDHPVEMWGGKFPNGSGNGIFGSVQRHEADLGYSAIYQWYCDVLDCSYPYIQAEVICLVPKPRIITNSMTILLPFTLSTWIAFIIAYFISSVLVLAFTLASRHLHGRKASEQLLGTAFYSAFNVFRLQLHQIPRLAHGSNSAAIFIRIALFYHFSLSVFWQGEIASILTVPRYEKPIDTVEDLVSRWPSVKWGANHNVWLYSIMNTTEPIFQQLVDKFVVLDEETLVRKTRTRDFAFFMERLPNKHYGFSPYINEDTVPFLRLMKYYIYRGFAVMILPRGSPYTQRLDDVIHWLFDTGITQKIENQVSMERINNHLQIMIQHSNRKEGGRTILTVTHIEGPLYIYLAGILISTVVFIAEKFIFFRKLVKLRLFQKRN